MTDREKAIVMAYTGVAMLTGDKLDLFYQYLEEILGRPVFTHELATQEMTDKIKEKSKPDFIKLCRETTEPIKHGRWETVTQKSKKPSARGRYINYTVNKCSNCGHSNGRHKSNYCANCGAKMDEVIDNG